MKGVICPGDMVTVIASKFSGAMTMSMFKFPTTDDMYKNNDMYVTGLFATGDVALVVAVLHDSVYLCRGDALGWVWRDFVVAV